MSVTIKDVAKRANVSISTVSRVLNHNYPVSKEARERVEQAIKECGYTMNALAGGLRSNNSKLIAVAIPGVAHSSFMELVRGLQKETDRRDCTLVIVDTGENEEVEKKVLENLLMWRISGLVIAPSCKRPLVVKEMLRQGIKVVVVDRDIRKYVETDCVLWENYETARRVIRYFLEMGHRKIALVCAQNKFTLGVDRVRGYLDELEVAGIIPPDEYYINRNSNYEEAYETAKRMMTSDNPPTAYLANSYFCTRGIIKAACELNLKIPDDISVISFSKFETNDYMTPKITTVEQNVCEMGEMAGRLLFERFDNEVAPLKEIVIHSELVKRDSVKKLN